jgi:enediyne polyketide synthase
MNAHQVAVVGIACRYPDANSPTELWQNVLAGRRAFRRMPDERTPLADYYSPDPTAPDRFYATKAAVLEGFTFDRVKYRVAGSTYRVTDLTHWLALDTAARALADAGFPDGEGLPKRSTGVVIGNSLTGEFSRASMMRLRWPFVRRMVGGTLRARGWDDATLADFLGELEAVYKAPFAPADEDTLAGGLANTIAGRICNHFDFGGGGYTVDGACSSSLLSVGTAYNALLGGEIDAAVVGGVDLSIDPFELIGFAKTGALASSEMLVYDRRSNGFWPGEGCGMLVLMRAEDAERQGRRSYATIAGWGYSSDGKGGITRPEAAGHILAMDRAYRRAGFDIGAVGYLEGHGTGTAVGDATELRAFTEARRKGGRHLPAVPISTLKGNIGHTKAAAGVGGLLKAILAVHHQVIPPATGNVEPHPELTGERPALRIPDGAELFPAGEPIRAGVSSMGFGGINTHMVIEQAVAQRRIELDPGVLQLTRSRQDCELLLFDADSTADLRGRLAGLHELAAKLSFAELGDLASSLHDELAGRRLRAAVVAAGPDEAAAGIAKLLGLLDSGARSVLQPADGVFLDSRRGQPAIGFLFPGQGVGRRSDGGALRRRFAEVDALYAARQGTAGTGDDLVDTAAAQPRIVTSSVAALRVLSRLGIEAELAAGHSLGELTALHWAGAYDERTLLELATARGRIMRDSSAGTGAMANIAAGPDQVRPLLADTAVVIAGYNSPGQTVVSGPATEVDEVCRRADRQGLTSMRLAVSHAFHSELVAPAAGQLRQEVARYELRPLRRPVASTITGEVLLGEQDLPELLGRQVRDPVRFTDALGAMAAELDLLIEVGPGLVLSRLAGEIAPELPVVSVEADSLSLAGLFRALGAAFVLGAPLRYRELSADRFTRPLPLDKELTFLANPCESEVPGLGDLAAIPLPAADPATVASRPAGHDEAEPAKPDGNRQPGGSPLEVLRRLAAERAELPLTAVSADSHPLDELHLSSITVGQIVNEASRELGLSAPAATSAYATSTLSQLAQLLELAGETAVPDEAGPTAPAGVQPWVRAFGIRWLEVPPAPPVPAAQPAGEWQVFAAEGDPVAEAIAGELRRTGLGDGVLLSLPADAGADQVPLMLAAGQAAVTAQGQLRFVAVGGRRGAAGLVKTAQLEAPSLLTTLVTLPLAELTADQLPGLAKAVVAEVAATERFTEVSYAADGSRHKPVLAAVQVAEPAELVLTAADVLLVTGGGKGITAESAISLARASGAAIGIIGRSDPAEDQGLADNLARMSAAGLRFHYSRGDVTSASQVTAAVADIEQRWGPVTAVLHGAGSNEPASLTTLDEDAFRQTLATKIDGLETVLAAVEPARLRLLVSFSSIIGRAGLRGEAHYATANHWLTELTEQVQAAHPQCRCLSLEWSVWSGTGMGERLGVLESLMREGVSPIPMDDGIAMLHRLLADPSAPSTVVVMGRVDGLPTVSLEPIELPLLRFLDRVRVYYPGIELVADAELSAADDPYLSDHLLDGDLLFPAVLGMEAMAQAARALTGRTDSPTLSDVEFLRPVVVPPDGSTVLRVAALQEQPGELVVVLRSSDTSFQADHFRARLSYHRRHEAAAPPAETDPARLPLDPVRDLYGTVLFQGNRFRRLLGYRQLSAMSCVADLTNSRVPDWFGGFLPDELVLADPGTRDAVMHSIQCCVPDATLLPAGIERLQLADPALDVKQLTMRARERSRDGDSYLYDVDVYAPDGQLVEQWQGLRLQAVRKQDGSGPWLPALLGPYLERRVLAVLDSRVGCVVYPDDPEVVGSGLEIRRRNTADALAWVIGHPVTVSYRPDGKPEVIGGPRVSSSHSAGVTLAVAAEQPVACDVELVVERRTADWHGLLGAEPLRLAKIISESRHEPLAVSATRVWSVLECLRKHGYAAADALTGGQPGNHGWVELRANGARIATFATQLADLVSPVVFAVLVDEEE